MVARDGARRRRVPLRERREATAVPRGRSTAQENCSDAEGSAPRDYASLVTMEVPASGIPLDRLLAHREWVRRVARAMVRDENVADDLEQGVWLEVLRRPPRMSGSIRGWFAAALRHDLADRRRSESARATREESVASGEAIPSAEELVARAEADKRVVVAVMDLAEPYRSTILYRFFQDLSPSVIAQRQGIPVATVDTRLRRALTLLRERFDAEHEGDREKWCLALLPLLRHSLNTSAARGTAAAAAGAIVMGAKVKVVAALVTVVVVAAGLLLWSSRSVQPEVATAPPIAQAPSAAVAPPPVRRAAPSPVKTDFGIDGMTRIGSQPAPASVSAWLVGTAAPNNEMWALAALGRPWFEAPDPTPPNARATSDSAGSFSLENLGIGTWFVTATFEGGRRASQSVELTAASSRRHVDLTAPTGGFALHGRAIHGDGTPFVGWIGVMAGNRVSEVWISTDEKGAFALAGIPPAASRLTGLLPDDVIVEALQAGRSLVREYVRMPHAEEVVIVVDPRGKTRHGRVTAGKDGGAVDGAIVQTFFNAGQEQFWSHATTGPDGRFEFVSPDGSARLDVEAAGFATVRREVAGGDDEVVVVLAQRGVVFGKVVRADDGSPAAGAVVQAVSPKWVNPLDGRTQTTSGTDGGYRMEPFVVGRVDVYVRGGGWVSEGLAELRQGALDLFEHQIAPGAEIEVALRVVRSAGIEGRVTDAKGDPVSCVNVEARKSGVPSLTASRSVTRADGTFSFVDLIPGAEWSIWVRPPTGEPKASDAVRLEPGTTARVEIRLDPTRQMAVTVLAGDTGAPVPNALVSVATASHGPWDSWKGSSTSWLTDEKGTIDVGPISGSCVGVYARAPGFVESHVAPETIDDARLRAVVRLDPAKPIRGRVVAPEGVPLDKRTVTADDGRDVSLVAEVDANGNFRIDSLPDQSWNLTAKIDWNGTVYEAASSARPGDSNVVLTLEPRRARPSIRVTVSDAQGNPLEEGVVRYSFMNGLKNSTMGEAAIRGGVASVPLPPVGGATAATLEVRPTPRGFAGSGVQSLTLTAPIPSELQVRLPSELRVTGRVVGPTGQGVGGVRVLAQPNAAGREEESHAVVLTDQNGEFDLGGLSTSFVYRIVCVPPAGFVRPNPVEARGGSSGIQIQMSAGKDVSITVTGPDGTPMANCFVTVMSGSAVVGNVATSQSGAARFTGLDPGTAYHVSITPYEMVITHQPRDDVAPVRLNGWKPQDTTVQLKAASPISGVVQDDAGRAVPGATVRCNRYTMDEGSTTTAGADGRFQIGGVPADEPVRLRLLIDGEHDMSSAMQSWPYDVETRGGAKDVVLIAGMRGLVSFRLEGVPHGVETRWGLFVAAKNGITREHGGVLKAENFLRLRGLVPELRYRLIVGPTADGRYALADDLVPGAPERTLTLVQGTPLTGTVVVPPEYKTTLGIEVTAQGELWTATTTADAQGHFRFAGLPSGELAVRAMARVGTGGYLWGRVTTQPGGDVTIQVELPK